MVARISSVRYSHVRLRTAPDILDSPFVDAIPPQIYCRGLFATASPLRELLLCMATIYPVLDISNC